MPQAMIKLGCIQEKWRMPAIGIEVLAMAAMRRQILDYGVLQVGVGYAMYCMVTSGPPTNIMGCMKPLF